MRLAQVLRKKCRAVMGAFQRLAQCKSQILESFRNRLCLCGINDFSRLLLKGFMLFVSP